MTFQLKNISTIFIAFGLLLSYSLVNENKNTDTAVETNNNIFPIEYVGDETLEYNKPMIPPKGRPAHLSGTFNIYRR